MTVLLKLSNTREDWVEERDYSGTMKGTPLLYSVPIANVYKKKMNRLTLQMMSATKKQLIKLFEGNAAEEYFAEDASISSQARMLLNKLRNKMLKIYISRSKLIAEQMIKQANDYSSFTVHRSLEKLSGGLSLATRELTPEMEEIIKAAVTNNVSLIRSIPEQYFLEIEGAVMRSITTGNGLQDLIPFINHRKTITMKRVNLIALDQTKKITVALNKQRSVESGLTKFEWVHSSASKEPRKLHLGYNGKTFSYDDLPIIDEKTGERGMPGQAINCKCIAVPILSFEKGEEVDS